MGDGTRPRQPLRRRRADARVDLRKALALRLEKGLSYAAIGKLCGGVKKQTVEKALRPFRTLLANPMAVAEYRREEPKLLDAARMRILSHMTDDAKLRKAPPNHLAFAYRQLFDSARLLRDQSTANVGLRAELVLRAHAQRREALKEAADEGELVSDGS